MRYTTTLADGLPYLLERGGVRGMEAAAVQETREHWFKILQEVLTETEADPNAGPLSLGYLREEVLRLRKLLKAGPDRDKVRVQTRERVRQLRERRRQGIELPPRKPKPPPEPETVETIRAWAKQRAELERFIRQQKRTGEPGLGG